MYCSILFILTFVLFRGGKTTLTPTLITVAYVAAAPSVNISSMTGDCKLQGSCELFINHVQGMENVRLLILEIKIRANDSCKMRTDISINTSHHGGRGGCRKCTRRRCMKGGWTGVGGWFDCFEAQRVNNMSHVDCMLNDGRQVSNIIANGCIFEFGWFLAHVLRLEMEPAGFDVCKNSPGFGPHL